MRIYLLLFNFEEEVFILVCFSIMHFLHQFDFFCTILSRSKNTCVNTAQYHSHSAIQTFCSDSLRQLSKIFTLSLIYLSPTFYRTSVLELINVLQGLSSFIHYFSYSQLISPDTFSETNIISHCTSFALVSKKWIDYVIESVFIESGFCFGYLALSWISFSE